MNFHTDKQLFQVAGARDRTTDPWITRAVIYPFTTEDFQFWVLFHQFLNFMIVTGHKNCDSGVAQLNDIIFDSSMSIEHITMVDFVKNDLKIIQMYEF